MPEETENFPLLQVDLQSRGVVVETHCRKAYVSVTGQSPPSAISSLGKGDKSWATLRLVGGLRYDPDHICTNGLG